MSQSPSTFKVLGLVIIATLLGGLLFAQDDAVEEAKPETSSETPAAEGLVTEEAADPVAEPKADLEAVPAEAAPEVKSAPTPAPVETAPATAKGTIRKADTNHAAWARVIASLTVFVLAVFVGFEVITKVPPTLHTPLMSGSNAISGITLVGAVIVACSMSFSGFVGFIAVTLATVNAVGGFMVTHRMLAMFKKR
ncbi:MAG: NAD(P) transhydrogenase subunit alpha [Planctomycetes bacterium]|nr:NAD(P) transhydrogenase subunit alpha [Planctomycetota bacterium]